MNDPDLAHILFVRVGQKNSQVRIDSKSAGAYAEKPAHAYIFGRGELFHLSALIVDAAQFERNAQTDADFVARRIMPVFSDLTKAHAQGVEVNGLLKISGGAQLFAVLFGLRSGLAADNNNRDSLRVAEGGERLKQFVAGIFWHA